MQPKSLLVTLFFIPLSGLSQGVIDTNRPGFTSTTGIVDPGQWQLETGLDYTHGSGSDPIGAFP